MLLVEFELDFFVAIIKGLVSNENCINLTEFSPCAILYPGIFIARLLHTSFHTLFALY